MRNGLAAGPLPPVLMYREPIEEACEMEDFSPLVAYGIAYIETIEGEEDGLWTASSVISGDGGHGLFQLTSSYPEDWLDPKANALYAVREFLAPAEAYWAGEGMRGADLGRCIAAEFNAGRAMAMLGHSEGNVDRYTTNGYAARWLAAYNRLLAGFHP